MMERVNLIPDDVGLTWGRRAIFFIDRKFLPVLGGAIGGALVVVLLAATVEGLVARFVERGTRRLEAERQSLVARLETETTELDVLNKAEDELKQQLESLQQRVRSLTAYTQTSGRWADMLHDVKIALPYGVWLTELDGSPDGTLRLAGGAFDDALVSQFMGQLKAIPRLTDVAFTFTKQAKIGHKGIVEFEISCHVVATEATL